VPPTIYQMEQVGKSLVLRFTAADAAREVA
jgi:hypothetical protein